MAIKINCILSLKWIIFLNPNGMIFGENASLDIGGSFVATTANAIQFGDRGWFSATDPEQPALLTVKPSAFFFNQINDGAIVNSADLQVSKGRSLLLMGSQISLNGGKLKAGEGKIDLIAIAPKQTIGITQNSKQFNLNIAPDLELADIQFLTELKSMLVEKLVVRSLFMAKRLILGMNLI